MANSQSDANLVMAASPHAGGITDALAQAAANGRDNTQIIYLREYKISPCSNCGCCAMENCCRIEDDAAFIFKLMLAAKTLIIAAPIYFYALPAHFKALIDRSQMFWQKGHLFDFAAKKAGIILTAGRKEGKMLFAGASLTLRWFLKPFAFGISQELFCRGADFKKDFLATYTPLAAQLGKTVS